MKNERPSAHLDQAVSLLDPGDNLGKLWTKPEPQRPVGGIADAQPNDHRTIWTLTHAISKIFVFGDDHGLVFQGIAPDGLVLGFAQSDLFHVLGVVRLEE